MTHILWHFYYLAAVIPSTVFLISETLLLFLYFIPCWSLSEIEPHSKVRLLSHNENSPNIYVSHLLWKRIRISPGPLLLHLGASVTVTSTVGPLVSRATHRPHRYIYSFFPALRAPLFLYRHTNIHLFIPIAPLGLDIVAMP